MSFDLAHLPRPIVVVGTPRSGTSLTAGLFARHGVWTGRCRIADFRNAKGYFENEALKRDLIRQAGGLVHKQRTAAPAPPGEWRDRVLAILHAEGYTGGQWLFKHSALYARLWLTDFAPVFVCCYRDPESIAASGAAIGMLDVRRAPSTISLHHRVMDELVADHGAHPVWPGNFTHGYFGPLETAFAAAGLAFDHETAEDFVDPSLWHDWSEDIAPA